MKSVVTSDKTPAAVGPYSAAVVHDNTVYVSGQLPIDAATGSMPEGIEAQTRQSLTNIKHLLEACGSSMEKLLKTTVLLHDINDFAAMNAVYSELVPDPFPARSAFAVKDLPKGALVEIEAVAAK